MTGKTLSVEPLIDPTAKVQATQAHFTYRASAYFPGESDEAEFFGARAIGSASAMTCGWATARSSCRAGASARAR